MTPPKNLSQLTHKFPAHTRMCSAAGDDPISPGQGSHIGFPESYGVIFTHQFIGIQIRSMSAVRRLLFRYTQLPAPIIRLIAAELLLNLINAGFLLILNIYMRKSGYGDEEIGSYLSYRFLGILMLAFPLGLFIKGRRLKPFFIAATIIIPLSSLAVLEGIRLHLPLFTKAMFLLWGIGIMQIHVCSLPFIMRSAPKELLSEAISLNYATWSLAMILCGIVIGILTRVSDWSEAAGWIVWDEYRILQLISIICALSVFLLIRLKEGAPRSNPVEFQKHLKSLVLDYDWPLILEVGLPTMIIAVGAGLTIPFINLFFFSVFGMDSDQFSILGSATAALVFVSALAVPHIKRRFGYMIAITLTQGLAILFLILMALTELVSHVPGILTAAVFFYMMRQPLMNMAGPITNELVMKYVGTRYQELVSALHSSIWSSSWFISAKVFQFFRSADLPYYQIFLITAALYAFGVFLYSFIIRKYRKLRDAGNLS